MGAEIFCSLLDELHEALKQDANEGFFHNRCSIVCAYGEGRLYGLRVRWTEEIHEHKSLEDPIFMKSRYNISGYLPCFAVTNKPYEYDDPSVCHFLWTAKRARKKGLATYMLDELDVRSAHDPIPEAEAFWSNYFAKVQAEIEMGNSRIADIQAESDRLLRHNPEGQARASRSCSKVDA